MIVCCCCDEYCVVLFVCFIRCSSLLEGGRTKLLGSNWLKRYFTLDAINGTLSYFVSESGEKKGMVLLGKVTKMDYSDVYRAKQVRRVSTYIYFYVVLLSCFESVRQ